MKGRGECRSAVEHRKTRRITDIKMDNVYSHSTWKTECSDSPICLLSTSDYANDASV